MELIGTWGLCNWLLLDIVASRLTHVGICSTAPLLFMQLSGGMDHGTAPVYSLADGVWAVPTLGTIDGVALNSGVWVSHHQVSWASP